MAEFDRLLEQANKTVGNYGGLISLLLAVKEGKANKVTYDPKTAAFYVDGRKINVLTIQKELGRIELRIAATIISYNQKLWSGGWTEAKWREEMGKLVEDNHIILGALALGSLGLAVVNPTVRRHIVRDEAALDRFRAAIKAGQIPSLPLMQNRGRSYIRSFYLTYQQINHKAHILAGYTEAKRILTPAEHCRTNKFGKEGCLEVAARGWVDINKMPPIGTLVCGQFCRCYLIFR